MSQGQGKKPGGGKPGGGMSGNEGLRGKQAGTRGKTESLRRTMEGIRDRAPGMPGGPGRSLDQAAQRMSGAEGALGEGDAPGALGQGSQALEQLQQGLEQLDQAMSNQQKIMQGLGRNGGFRPQAIRRRGGRTGEDLSPVELPDAEDYRPPAELREEVLRSMEEKMPKSRERRIRDYFKRITE